MCTVRRKFVQGVLISLFYCLGGEIASIGRISPRNSRPIYYSVCMSCGDPCQPSLINRCKSAKEYIQEIKERLSSVYTLSFTFASITFLWCAFMPMSTVQTLSGCLHTEPTELYVCQHNFSQLFTLADRVRFTRKTSMLGFP